MLCQDNNLVIKVSGFGDFSQRILAPSSTAKTPTLRRYPKPETNGKFAPENNPPWKFGDSGLGKPSIFLGAMNC